MLQLVDAVEHDSSETVWLGRQQVLKYAEPLTVTLDVQRDPLVVIVERRAGDRLAFLIEIHRQLLDVERRQLARQTLDDARRMTEAFEPAPRHPAGNHRPVDARRRRM